MCPIRVRPLIVPPIGLPPGFRAFPCAHDAVANAVIRAAEGANPGTLTFGPLAARCTLGIVVTPPRPMSDTIAIGLAAVAVRDALTSLAPPRMIVDSTLTRITVNTREAGRVETWHDPRDKPAWLVLGADVAVAQPKRPHDRDPAHTTLAAEGFKVTGAEVMAAICRHLVRWIDSWTETAGRMGAAG